MHYPTATPFSKLLFLKMLLRNVDIQLTYMLKRRMLLFLDVICLTDKVVLHEEPWDLEHIYGILDKDSKIKILVISMSFSGPVLLANCPKC